MADKELNIKSSTIEKGLEIATNFVDKLISPSVSEVGLLLKEKVSLWRFNNQVKMLNKAKEICEANNIDPKMISLKLLCPLIEFSGFEEYSRRQLTGNMILNCGGNHNRHIEEWIKSGEIDKIVCGNATFVRINNI